MWGAFLTEPVVFNGNFGVEDFALVMEKAVRSSPSSI